LTKNRLEVRIASSDDIESMVNLWLESAQYHGQIDSRLQFAPDAAEATRNYFASQVPLDNFIAFIASRGDEDIGFIEARVMEKPPIHLIRKIGFIGALFVKPEERRKGVGSHLYENVQDWFMEQKIVKYRLAVASMNAVGIEFWRKLGYKQLILQMELLNE